MAQVKITNLSFSFAEVPVFQDFNLTIEDGEILGLVGPSGCGKTSLARCISGLANPTSGSISVGERLLFDKQSKRNIPPERRDIGMVFQDYAVWPHKTVWDNVEYPLLRRKVAKAERMEKVKEAIRQVRMEGYEQHLPSQLSGGQQQRVAIARALVCSQDLIILDEPITNLDAKLREEMIVEIQLLQKNLGATILYITHDQETALKLCDRICIMNGQGEIAQLAEDEQIILEPNNRFVFEFIGVSNFIKVMKQGDVFKFFLPKQELEGRLDLLTGIRLGNQPNIEGLATVEKLEDNIMYDLGVRPMNIVFDQDSNLLAKVLRKVFLGAQYNYFLDFAGQELRVEMNALDALKTTSPEVGDMVGIKFLRPFFYPHEEAKVNGTAKTI